MKLTKRLAVGYNLLKKSRVVIKKDIDEEAINYFNNILNDAQPKTPGDKELCQLVKAMYNENKNKFMEFIKNTRFECMVLWTESMPIVHFLGLHGTVYLRWNSGRQMYCVSPFKLHIIAKKQHEQNVPETVINVSPNNVFEEKCELYEEPEPLFLARMMSTVHDTDKITNWGDD